MLPESIIDYIPTFYRRDEKLIAFADKIYSILADLKSDTLGLNDLIDPMKIPSNLLKNLGYLLNAGIRASDSETIKRQKIVYAVQAHKRRGSFSLDAKPKIDAIAGGDSQVLHAWLSDDWILVGDGNAPAEAYWASLGADGIDDDLGLALIGSGLEMEVAGNVYIDVDNNSLSAAEQDQIEAEMEDVVPAYCYVHFGYINGSGKFQEYFMMG